jgi:hypothetical protein
MGVLIDGVWTDGELPQEYGDGGRFKRAESQFRDRITTDGSSGFKAEPGQRICRTKGHHGHVDRGRDRAQEPRSGRLRRQPAA